MLKFLLDDKIYTFIVFIITLISILSTIYLKLKNLNKKEYLYLCLAHSEKKINSAQLLLQILDPYLPISDDNVSIQSSQKKLLSQSFEILKELKTIKYNFLSKGTIKKINLFISEIKSNKVNLETCKLIRRYIISDIKIGEKMFKKILKKIDLFNNYNILSKYNISIHLSKSLKPLLYNEINY